MKAARPAVQLCRPYQSVNIAPSLPIRSMLGYGTHHPAVVDAGIEPADVVAKDTRMFGLSVFAMSTFLSSSIRVRMCDVLPPTEPPMRLGNQHLALRIMLRRIGKTNHALGGRGPGTTEFQFTGS